MPVVRVERTRCRVQHEHSLGVVWKDKDTLLPSDHDVRCIRESRCYNTFVVRVALSRAKQNSVAGSVGHPFAQDTRGSSPWAQPRCSNLFALEITAVSSVGITCEPSCHRFLAPHHRRPSSCEFLAHMLVYRLTILFNPTA